ncbi:hypothetical protein RJ639_034697 [Escallonia herrerae]|uniref:Integrase catalytic domain-containing protein n=1 Tax=Escallonia herrerae TaxID=1293975 RepID=A0AA88X420_9ASTE|nr:hypothetical protein RJ639_034697 [Escallonia herrerae]
MNWESKFQELQYRVELLTQAVVNTPAGGVEHSSRPQGPQPKSYWGARDAKELENFLFYVEQYFLAIKVDSEETKVSMTAMYLVGDAKLWWQKKYAEIEDGSCVINTWEILKRELKIDRLFFFMEGLKPWARTKLNRSRVNNLNEAIIDAESLSDYNSEPQRPPQRGNPSRTNGGKKPGGWEPRRGQEWGKTQGHGDVPGKGLMNVDIKDNGKAIKAMVDTGATHNYISSTEVERLGLTLNIDEIFQQSFSCNPHPPKESEHEANFKKNEKSVSRELSIDPLNDQDGDAINSSLMDDREKLKETDEYKWAVEEKWVSRQRELKIQAMPKGRGRWLLFNRVTTGPKWGDDVQEYVKTCLTCQQDKVERRKKAGLLQPLPISTRPWESVSRDFITGLPKVEDLGKILVVVDRFSKYASFIAAPKYCSAEETAQLFFRYVVKYWGMPQDIVTTRRMKKHADKNTRSQEFNGGDKVMVKLLPQDRKFLSGRDSRLLQKYEGPLTIVKKIDKMVYKVAPPHWWSGQLHPIFHVSMLKPFYEDAADPSRGEIKRPGL